MTLKKYALSLALMVAVPLLASAQNLGLQKLMATKSSPSSLVADEGSSTAVSSSKAQEAVQPLVDYVYSQASGESAPLQFMEDVSLDRELNVQTAEKWTAGSFTTSVTTRSKTKSSVRDAVAKAVLGGYVAKDLGSNGSTYNSFMTLYKDENGDYKMANVYNAADTVSISIDLENGTVEIPAQKMYTHSTYGDIYLYPVDLDKKVYNPKGTVTGTIDSDGVIKLSSWGLFIIDGKYAGYSMNAFSSSEWIPSNATINNVTTKGETTQYISLIEQVSENEIRIYNFAGNGTSVYAMITPSKTVKVSPQYIAYNALYGYFFCYPADFTLSKVYTSQPIVGTATDNTITFGNWVVSPRNTGTNLARANVSTVINTTFSIKYPEVKEANFSGSGTEASPYLISSADDLIALSQAVGNGESYQNIYFKQTADISLSSVGGQYEPIGDVTNPFQGNYNGAGHAISDLTVNRRGFCDNGIFGYVGNAGVINNLKAKNCKLTTTGSFGSILVGRNYGTIQYCDVEKSTINAQSDIVGGVVGSNYGTVTECSFNGNISNTGDAGGIAGYNGGKLTFCYSYGSINLSGYYSSIYHCIGGVVGSVYPSNKSECVVSDCFFAGTASDPSGYGMVGGIVGDLLIAKVERCFNVGSIYSGKNSSEACFIGGIVAFISESEMNDCYNAGLVYSTDSSNDNVGGIAGYLSLTYTNGLPTRLSTIKNCYNCGVVNAPTTHGKSGMYGAVFNYNGYTPGDGMFTNSFSDIQVTGLNSGTDFDKRTSYFTSGTLPEGFSSDVWEAESNTYPVLKSLKNSDASKVSASSMALQNNETVRKVKTNFTLNAPSGSDVIWNLDTSGSYVTSTDGLEISGNTVKIKDIYSTELLVASNADKTVIKPYILSVVPKVFDGEGTEASPYLIKNVADFEKLQNAVANKQQPHEGDFFKMTADIDFTGSSFTGVSGNTTYMFGGSFDGDNHTIHNLNINSVAYDSEGKVSKDDSYSYSGLFGACNDSCTIKNLNMAADNKFSVYSYSAPIVGFTAGKVINCRNYADITGAYQYIAGIAGYATSTAEISNCYNAGNVTAGYRGAGGIAGYSSAKVELCQNDGDVSAAFVNSIVKDGIQSVAGGITSYNLGSIDRCVNNGTVTSYKQEGGITGTNNNSYSLGDITNSVNNGLVVCKSEDTNRGSIIGYNLSKGNVSNNYYDASINTYGAASNVAINGVTGLSSTALTSGTALSGLSADDFSFKANAYPVLKQFENEESSAALRNIYVGFGDGEYVTNVVKSVSLASDSNIKWSLAQNANFTLSGTTLNVTIPTDMKVASDTLTAVYGDGKCSKVYYLSSMPVILNGAGTAENPFQISSVDDMNKLADFMETSGMEYAGYFFKVMNDIDYKGDSIKLIATGNVNFKGDFDGNGKTISGYVYKDVTTKTGKNIGVFANVGSGGVIHDLTLNGSFDGNTYTGGFVGKLSGTVRNCVHKGSVTTTKSYAGGIACIAYESAVIENCSNEGTVTTTTTYAGGIVSTANNGSQITGCSNKGTVTATTSYAGGIVANNNGKIVDSYNNGSVVAKNYVGGIVGNAGVTDTIINSYNAAPITVNGGTVGGIIGTTVASGKGYVEKCYNTAKITAQGNLGGLIGKVQKGCVIIDCYNTGDITSTKSTYVGGLIGTLTGDYENYPISVDNCYNTGKVVSTGSYSGGVFGSASKCTVNDCYNQGAVEVSSTAKTLATGGFAGSFSGMAYDCWNVGEVTATGYGTGGFSGLGSGEIDGCANFADVTATGIGNTGTYTNAGGLWGYGKCPIHNSYNFGTVTAPGCLAGINGGLFADAILTNSYNCGELDNTSSDNTIGNAVRFSVGAKPSNVTLSNLFYDTTVNPVSYDIDSLATGLSMQKMLTAPLGDAFEYNKAAYPLNPDFEEYAVPNMFVSSIEFIGASDSLTNVTGQFYVANLKGVTVTSSDNITIEGNVATPTEIGDAWVTYAAELNGFKYEKTYKLKITKVSGISDILDGGKTVVSRTYYDLNGYEVKNPVLGGFYIVKSKYNDGTDSVDKTYLKD